MGGSLPEMAVGGLRLDLYVQNKAVCNARFKGMMPGMADWLHPNQVLACLLGLGTVSCGRWPSRRSVTKEPSQGRKNERAKTWSPVLHSRAGTWAPGSPGVFQGKDPCPQAIYSPSPATLWRPRSRHHRHVSAFFLEAGRGESSGRGD